MDDEIKRLLDTCKNANDAMKNTKMAKEIRIIAEEKDSLNDFLSEREPNFKGINSCENPTINEEIIDTRKIRIIFSIKDYVEIATMGYTRSIEDYVRNDLFVNEQTIVHCIDNNSDYTFQEIPDLIHFIESNTIKNKNDEKED